jgi:hypothetical protein
MNMVQLLEPKRIPKYVNQLGYTPVYMPTVLREPMTGQVIGHAYKINASEFQQQILPPGFGSSKGCLRTNQINLPNFS